MGNIEEFRNKIILGNNIETLRKIPDDSIHLVITSPPYNIGNIDMSEKIHKRGMNKIRDWDDSLPSLGIMSKGYDGFEDNLPHSQYVDQQRELIKECIRILHPNGAIFYNHKIRIIDGIMRDHHDILNGFPVRQMIIWNRYSSMARTNRLFQQSYEVIYMINKKPNTGLYLTEQGMNYSDIWAFCCERDNKHPAPYPVQLPYFAISGVDVKKTFDTDKMIVLDPYSGSGTTALVAKELGHDYIGLELSEQYREMSLERLAKTDVRSELAEAGLLEGKDRDIHRQVKFFGIDHNNVNKIQL